MSGKGRMAIFFSLMLLLPLLITSFSDDSYNLNHIKAKNTTIHTQSALVDVETWQVNDNWMYSGYLDVGDFIASSGVSTNIEYLYGNLDETVAEIYISSIDNHSSLTYKIESTGTYEAQNVNLDGTNGDISVIMETVEIIRASDMAVVSQEAMINIDFCGYILWWCVDVDVADLNVLNSYSPALEGLDFPLNVGEEWSANYHQETEYSGSANYGVSIPNDSEDYNSSTWEIVSQGFSGVSYPGCTQSYNITTYDSDGDASGYRWYCPAIRGDIKTSFTESVGFVAVHELTAYQPTTRYKEVNIDIEYPLSPTDTEISAWINVTNQGSFVPGQSLEFRYEIEDEIQQITTDDNGTYHLQFNTGNMSDDSHSSDDFASHGILAWINNSDSIPDIIGASSLSTDLNVHEIDLVTRTEGVTVQRIRNNDTITLDSVYGFNAISGDALVFSVPVINKGLTNSPSTILRINSPDTSVTYAPVPPLASLEESRVEVNWTVSDSQSFGYVYLEFLVDPNENISQDGNKSNNYGIFSLYIGAMPSAVITSLSEILTMEEISISGLDSTDSDGGEFICEFQIKTVEGGWNTALEEDCIYEWSWYDDGIFDIFLIITDEENDVSSTQTSVTVLNRPPEITLISNFDSIPVLSEVIFQITDRIDLDSQSPNSPIDILWNNVSCKEGQIGIKCTVTPYLEGELIVEVSATDDDGASILSSHSVMVTNIPPYDPQVEVWVGPIKLSPDSRGVFTANEGDVITMRAWASDSINDINNLNFTWAPDAENNPQLVYSSQGHMGEINHTYNYSGLQLATLQIVDDNGAPFSLDNGQDIMIIPIEIENVIPSIITLNSRLPVQEGEELLFDVGIFDTANDLSSLISCFDIDPLVNSDSIGNSADDCDINSNYMSYVWDDVLSTPDFIIFHLTDDDNSTVSIEIDIDVRNVRPTAVASLNSIAPIQGEVISLSANGTIDTEFDIENMQYHWDIDTSVDSDNDGNPSNDIDMEGRWIQLVYDTEGKKIVKLTVYDESESSSVTMIVEVEKAPFNLGTSVKANSSSILLLTLIISGAAILSLRYRNEDKDNKEIEKKIATIDDLFDNSLSTSKMNEDIHNVSERTNNSETDEINGETLEKETPIPLIDDLQSSDSQFQKMPVNDIMNEEDIEALFED